MSFVSLILAAALLCLTVTSCGNTGASASESGSDTESDVADTSAVKDVEVDEEEHNYRFVSQDGDSYTYRDDVTGETATVTITCTSGTAGAFTVTENTIAFSGFDADSVYTLSGSFYGNITLSGNEDYKTELVLSGLSLTSYTEAPITLIGADKVTVSAKKNTENYIYDMRDAVDESGISAAVYADCDLDIEGKGALYIVSQNNNGIHTKDDLSVKNLSLQVTCEDNALKGNDSVTVKSGTVVLVARTGDGIKTKNSDLSSKGKQRGDVVLSGGDITVYAACDGIDAAHDVTVDESNAALTLSVYTDKYSPYSEEVSTTAESVIYIRFTSDIYHYSLKYTNDAGDAVWYHSSDCKTVGSYRYYPIEKPDGYGYLQLFVSDGQTAGQEETYTAASERLSVNTSCDTIALSVRSGALRFGWTNYTKQSAGGMGGPGGMGGMSEGNADKGDYSTKGIKAGNAVTIGAGTVTVKSYDDCLHADNGTALENGETPLGNVTITGGTLTLYSNDDGIHADGKATVSGGSVNITGSYEGIEGETVEISGGDVAVISSDDGLNGTGTSGESMVISGGTLYVLAGGDGVDSNSRSSYDGILFSGGRSVIISTGNADSSIDTEAGYRYAGGLVCAVGRSGGMSRESTMCGNFSEIGKTASVSLTAGSYLVVSDVVTLKSPVSMNGFVVLLGNTTAGVSVKTSVTAVCDENGVVWNCPERRRNLKTISSIKKGYTDICPYILFLRRRS